PSTQGNFTGTSRRRMRRISAPDGKTYAPTKRKRGLGPIAAHLERRGRERAMGRIITSRTHVNCCASMKNPRDYCGCRAWFLPLETMLLPLPIRDTVEYCLR